MGIRKKLCCLFSAILALSICMPSGAVEAFADQGTSDDSATAATSDGSELAGSTSVDSTASTATTGNAADVASSSTSDSAAETTSDSSGSADDASVASTAESVTDSDSVDAVATSDSDSTITSADETATPTLRQALAASAAAPASVTAYGSGSGSEVEADITSVSIQKPLGTPVDEVSTGSSFYLVIGWKVTNTSQILNEGDYFDITLPDTLRFSASFTDYEFDITDSSGTVVGTAYVTPGTDNVGGTVRVIFKDAINGKYSVAGTLNIQAVVNSTGIDGDTTINITVSTTSSSVSTDLGVGVAPIGTDERVGKWGVRSDTNSGQVYWYVRINYAGDNLDNAKITDSLTGGDGTEQYVTDSFTLRRVTFASNGNVETLETITDLSSMLTFGEDRQSFTLDLSDMLSEGDQYVLTYRTTYTSGTLSNNVKLYSGSDTVIDSTTSSFTWQSATGNADGTLANRIEIIKVDAEDNSKTLAGATFLVTAEDGSTFTLTTGEDGTVISDLLTAGTYTVVETEAPAGYELDDTVYTLEVSSSGGAVLTVEDSPVKTSDSVEEDEAGSSVTPSKGDLPKTGDKGTPASSLAAIALATLGTALVLRRRAAGRSDR